MHGWTVVTAAIKSYSLLYSCTVVQLRRGYATCEGRQYRKSTPLGLTVNLWRNSTILSNSATELTIDWLLLRSSYARPAGRGKREGNMKSKLAWADRQLLAKSRDVRDSGLASHLKWECEDHISSGSARDLVDDKTEHLLRLCRQGGPNRRFPISWLAEAHSPLPDAKWLKYQAWIWSNPSVRWLGGTSSTTRRRTSSVSCPEYGSRPVYTCPVSACFSDLCRQSFLRRPQF